MKNCKTLAVCMVLFGAALSALVNAWAVTPEQPAAAPSAKAKAAKPAKASVDAADTTDWHTQMQEQAKAAADLQSRQSELEKRVLEAERKSIDWWFAWLAIFTTLIGVGVAFMAFIPFLLARKDKELSALEMEATRRVRQDMERLLQETASDREKTQKHENQSRESLAQTQQNAEASARLLQNLQSSATDTQEKTQQQQAAAQQVLASPTAEPIDRLRAQAVKAEANQDAELAVLLWQRVLDLAPHDANAAFNYAYWLQGKFEKSPHATATDWRLVSQAYAKADQLGRGVPQDGSIPNNWGNALAAQAQALKEQDLAGARALWKQAGEKYAQALAIKADKHEAAYNWGSALDDEAQALKEQDLAGARALWKQAGEKYAQALAIKADKHEAACNWGIALDDEAQALQEQDLAGARALWKQAGEKYAQALAIKADKHEAAYNWGVAFFAEAQAIKSSVPNEAIALLAQAQSLLERHRDMGEAGAKEVAYNLACVYALQNRAGPAVAQLEVCRLSGELEARASHWRTDPDLDTIRPSPEYQAWKQKHFPNE